MVKKLDEMLGKKVVGRSGAMYPERYGKIVGEDNQEFGFNSWVIKWEDGTFDTHTKHTLVHISEAVGIGVYYE